MDAAIIARAENICLLHFLHEVPSKPLPIPRNQQSGRDGQYSLTFDNERHLSRALAFISNVEDNNNRIPAICIIENHDSKVLEVIAAVNKLNGADGQDTLQKMGNGFNNIFVLLSRALDDQNASTENDIFEAIIAMCQMRILSRLRLCSPTNSRSNQNIKPPIDKMLERSLESLNLIREELDGDVNLSLTFQVFKERSKHVISKVKLWRNHQVLPELQELVKEIHTLSKLDQLKPLIESIKDGLTNAEFRSSLLDIIGKVAMYKRISRLLHRVAKRSSLVRQATFVPVELPLDMFHQPSLGLYVPSLEVTVSRISKKRRRKWDLRQICSLLDKRLPDVEGEFAERVKKTLCEGKIHAEVQIILYCELRQPKLPPRVVSSSKDACYLCNALIGMLVDWYTPQCHGRIYLAWHLPQLPLSSSLGDRFDKILERKVESSIKKLLRSGEPIKLPQPKESTLWVLMTSHSTITPTSVPSQKSIVNMDSQIPEHEDTNESTRPNIGHSHALNNRDANVLMGIPANTEGDSTNQNSKEPDFVKGGEKESSDKEQSEVDEPTDNQSSGHIPGPSNANQDLLSREGFKKSRVTMSMNQPHSGIVDNYKTSPSHDGGKIHLQLEYSSEEHSRLAENLSRRLKYSVEWLGPDAMTALEETKTITIIDIEKEGFGRSYPISESCRIYLRYRDSILKVDLHPRDN